MATKLKTFRMNTNLESITDNFIEFENYYWGINMSDLTSMIHAALKKYLEDRIFDYVETLSPHTTEVVRMKAGKIIHMKAYPEEEEMIYDMAIMFIREYPTVFENIVTNNKDNDGYSKLYDKDKVMEDDEYAKKVVMELAEAKAQKEIANEQ